MSMRNRLKAGDFIVPIPLGLPITLQYDADGILKSVSLWKDDDISESTIHDYSSGTFNDKPYTECILDAIRESKIVPNVIAMKGGTTYVKGVMLFNARITSCGELPECAISSMTAMLIAGVDCKFHAFTVKSYAAMFKGSSPIRKWLSLNKFEVLPGFLAPFNDASKLDDLIRSRCAEVLHNNNVMSYAVFNVSEEHVYSNHLVQENVSGSVRNNFNEYGAILSKFNCGGSGILTTKYYDVYKHNIYSGTYLVLRDGEIIDSYVLKPSEKDPRPKQISCSVCGKLMSARAVTRCEDKHCLSRKYVMVAHMLSTLKLPVLTFPRYQELVKSHTVQMASDILELEEYEETPIEVSLTTLLCSLITDSEVPDRRVISSFVSQCHNSIETVMYYADNPLKISSDLNLGNVRSNSLRDWFEDAENVLLLAAMLQLHNLSIVDTDRYYEAPPIFRNTTICVTGDFSIGNLQDVRGILGSYSAKVVTQLSPDVKFVVVGDKQSNIDGRVVSDARIANVPVISESTFLKQFDIADDIKQNLL